MASYSVKLRSGAKMPLLGLGTYMPSSDRSVIKAAVLSALDNGYRHFDTAFVYNNEEAVGEALKIAFEKGIVKREDVFITTKLPSNGHANDKVRHFLEISLKKLQLSYVDMYLVHCPIAYKYVTDDVLWPAEAGSRVDTDTTQIDTWKAMEELVDAGLAKDIGLSNYNSKQIQDICDKARIKPSNLQVECHLYFQQENLFNYCKSLGVVFSAYAPFGSPEMKEVHKTKFHVEIPDYPRVLENSKITEIARKYKKTEAQITLRWLIQRGIVPLPKSATASRIKENFEVFDFLLTEEEMASLRAMDKGIRYFKFLLTPNGHEVKGYPFNEDF